MGFDGCSQAGRGSGPVRLTYWSAANVQEVELARELTARWNAEHPEAQVVHQPIPESQSSEEVLLAAIAAKTTPDLCSVIWPGVVEQFVRARALVRLDTFPDFFAVMTARMDSGLLEQYRSPDGGFYQIPWKTNPILIQYNNLSFCKTDLQSSL